MIEDMNDIDGEVISIGFLLMTYEMHVIYWVKYD